MLKATWYKKEGERNTKKSPMNYKNRREREIKKLRIIINKKTNIARSSNKNGPFSVSQKSERNLVTPSVGIFVV